MDMKEVLLQLRNEHGLTQTALSKAINVGSSAISKYETGRSMPDYDALLKIADCYGVSLDYLFGRTQIRTSVQRLEEELKTRSGMVPIDAIFKLSQADKELVGLLLLSLLEKEEYQDK